MDKAIQDALDQAGDIEMDGRVLEGSPAESSSKKDAKPVVTSEDSSPAEDTQEPRNTAQESESQEATEEDEPFHKNPRFQEMSRERREYKRRFQDMEAKYNQLVGKFDEFSRSKSQGETPQGPQVSPDQLQAADQLFQILKQVPGFKEQFDEMQAIKDQNKALTDAQRDQAFEKEEQELVGLFEKMGLASSKDRATIEERFDELEEYIDKHPMYKRMKQEPGVWKEAARSLYFDKASEIGKRSANRDLINNQKKAKANMTESGSGTKSSGGKKLSGNAVRDIVTLINDAGGDDAVDMNA